jgi:isochorismate synthase
LKKGIDLHEGVFKKVVVSQEEIIETDSFDLVSVFEKLIESYPNVVIVGFIQNRFMDGSYRNDYLKLRTKVFYYGNRTQKKSWLDEVIWQKKEMEEQQFVTDFILNNLKNLTSEVAISSLIP